MFFPVPSRREPAPGEGADGCIAERRSAEQTGGALCNFTLAASGLSVVATVLLLLVWVPTAAQAEPGRSFRPMGIAPVLLLCWAMGTVPGLVIGLGQLWWRPRVYGLVSLAAACLPLVAFQFTSWLLLDLRGIGGE